uniref:RCC1-like domain-containing protein n=1 Tax=Globisporangium ultimum (strain ATCC 200006 / CBS 805.95 / DAOM BR144) TaxID=431595 RepID=K3WC09_GLOUD
RTKKEDASAPGVAFVWGTPFGLSLDEESQLANVSDASALATFNPRPAQDGSQVDILKFPSSLRRVVQVSCGYRHTALVTDNRYLYTFGYGECGRLGHGDEDSVTEPMAVSFFVSLIQSVGVDVGGIAQVSCGREHTMAVLVNGDLYGFGWAEAGRLGTGDTGSCLFPTKVLALQDVQAVACGREHTLALKKDGQVYAFGAGFGGRLGNDSEADEEYPVLVQGLDGERVVRIDAGECHSGAVNDMGEVFTWGFGNSGALGNGTRENRLLPDKIVGPWAAEQDRDGKAAAVTSIACGSYHTLVSTSTGKLYGWGDSAAGQLGAENTSAEDMVVLSPQEIQFRPAIEENNGKKKSPRSSSKSPAMIRDIACGTFTS